MNLLFITDTPCKDTGFGKVARNLSLGLKNIFDNIYIWGLGHDQNKHHDFPFLIRSANPENSNWKSEKNLSQLLIFIKSLPKPLKILIQYDPFRLTELIPFLSKAKEEKIEIITYAAIDSFLIQKDIEWLKFSDKIAVYSEFGQKRIKEDSNLTSTVIPLGIDETFKRKSVDRTYLFENIKPDDVLMLYVNSNNIKKSAQKSLDILSLLLKKTDRIKLYLHTPSYNPNYKIDLRYYASCLKIPRENIYFADSILDSGYCSNENLNNIYNCADLFISTSGSEGFGFTPCEAAMTYCPIAIPIHTSLEDIFGESMATILPTNGYFLDEFGRLHNNIDINLSAEIIYSEIQSDSIYTKAENAYRRVSEFTWKKCIKSWQKFLCC